MGISTRTPIRFGLLLAGGFVLATGVCFAGSNRRPERARAAYERAQAMRKRLEAKPTRLRTPAAYRRVIREYRAVYWNDFAYVKAPVAAQAMGDLYAEMGRVYSNQAYFRDAVKAYQYLIDQYPVCSMARQAQLSLGKVYLADLHDYRRSQEVFRSIIKNHPGSSEAREARVKLRETAHALAERKMEASASAPRAAARSPRGSSGTVVQNASATEPTTRGLVEVTEIHDWVGPNYTRVVIGAQAPIKFEAMRLTHPDRIVFDLPNTRVNRALLRKSFPIEGHFLKQIRVGQFTHTVTRVVLDVENVEDYSVFPLPNPFRLIIDVHGTAAPGMQMASRQPVPKRSSAAAPSPRTQAAARVPAKPTAKPKAEARTQARREAKRTKSKPAVVAASVAPPPATPKKEEIPVSAKPASPTENGSQTLTRALGLKVARIVIDAGHGGHDTGTIGPTGLEEKNVVLDIALRLRKLLETRTDSQVVMTRSTDKFIPLEERTAIANEKGADLFVSIHANSSRDRHVRGIETYYLNFTTDPEALEIAARENATSQESVHQLQSLIKKIALSDKVEESQELARDVQKDLYRDMSHVSRGIHNRGVRKAPFVVLIGANMPSILAEVGFLSNPHSEHLMRKGSYREDIAKALFQGIEKYINNLGGVRVAQRIQ